MCLALEGKSMRGKVDRRRGLTSLRIYNGLNYGKVLILATIASPKLNTRNQRSNSFPDYRHRLILHVRAARLSALAFGVDTATAALYRRSDR